jgi:hypothetical protein
VSFYLFAVRLALVPATGWGSWRSKILPFLTLSLVPLGCCVRLTRGAVLETIGQGYVRTARAKGLSRRRLLVQHVLRNSLVPVLNEVGPLLGAMLTTVFVVRGRVRRSRLARHYVSATTASDYPLLLGMTVVLTFLSSPRTCSSTSHSPRSIRGCVTGVCRRLGGCPGSARSEHCFHRLGEIRHAERLLDEVHLVRVAVVDLPRMS